MHDTGRPTLRARLQAGTSTRFGGLPGVFWILWSGNFVNRIGTMAIPFLSTYLHGERGLSLTETGSVLAVLGAGSVISQPVGGAIADRWRRRAALTGGTVATGVILLGLGYAQHATVIITLAFLLGVATDLFRPASQALVADIVDPASRPRAYGLLLWAVNLGFSVSMALGGVLARDGFLHLFWINALACASFGAIVWFGIGRDHDHGGHVGGGWAAEVLRDRTMLCFVLLTLVGAVVFHQALTTLPLAMGMDGLTTSAYGAVMAVNGLTIVVLQPAFGHLLGRIDRTRGLVVAMLLMAVGNGLLSWTGTTLQYAGAVVVWTLGEVMLTTLGAAAVADLAPRHLRGRYNGLYGLAWGAAALIAPLAGTRLLELGAPVLWGTCAAACLLAAAGQAALGNALRRRGV